jgi:hypothetical protein
MQIQQQQQPDLGRQGISPIPQQSSVQQLQVVVHPQSGGSSSAGPSASGAPAASGAPPASALYPAGPGQAWRAKKNSQGKGRQGAQAPAAPQVQSPVAPGPPSPSPDELKKRAAKEKWHQRGLSRDSALAWAGTTYRHGKIWAIEERERTWETALKQSWLYAVAWILTIHATALALWYDDVYSKSLSHLLHIPDAYMEQLMVFFPVFLISVMWIWHVLRSVEDHDCHFWEWTLKFDDAVEEISKYQHDQRPDPMSAGEWKRDQLGIYGRLTKRKLDPDEGILKKTLNLFVSMELVTGLLVPSVVNDTMAPDVVWDRLNRAVRSMHQVNIDRFDNGFGDSVYADSVLAAYHIWLHRRYVRRKFITEQVF